MRRQNVLFSVALALIASSASPSLASSTSPGRAENVTAVDTGFIYFLHDGTRTPPPACATDPRWILDPNSAGAKNMYEAILYARKNGQRVIVQGTGTCNVSTTNELVAWVVIYDF